VYVAPPLRYGWAGGTFTLMASSLEHPAFHEPRLGRSVSIDHAAALLKVSRRTIYNRIKEGRLQTMRTIGGSQRVLVDSLHDLGFRPQPYSATAMAALFAARAVPRP